MARTFIERLPTSELEELRDQAETREDWDTVQRCEDELERRDYDASDPASPQNTAEDARDTSWLATRTYAADNPDNYRYH